MFECPDTFNGLEDDTKGRHEIRSGGKHRNKMNGCVQKVLKEVHLINTIAV